MSEKDLIHWRVDALEKQMSSLTADIQILMRAMWLAIGGLTVVNILLPLLDKLGTAI